MIDPQHSQDDNRPSRWNRLVDRIDLEAETVDVDMVWLSWVFSFLMMAAGILFLLTVPPLLLWRFARRL